MFKFVPENISGGVPNTHFYMYLHGIPPLLLHLHAPIPWVPIVSYHVNHIGKCDEFQCTVVGVAR